MIVAEQRGDVRARHFFLNEQHELALREGTSFGRSPNFAPIDWSAHASRLFATFSSAVQPPERTPDPAVANHRFIVAAPSSLEKVSSSRAAQATGGRLPFQPQFAGDQAALLNKLGLDLVSVKDGDAIVHVPATRLPQLQAKLNELQHAGRRDRDRWINVAEFRPVPWSDRISEKWLGSLPAESAVDAHLRFFPVLPRVDAERALEAIRGHLEGEERLVRVGRDFSGRYWCAARLTKRSMARIAKKFPSIQSIHPPLFTDLAAIARSSRARPALATRAAQAPDVSALPTVAMLDAGVPEDHAALRPFVRGRYRDPILGGQLQTQGHHGCNVASVIVFGRVPDAPSNEDDLPAGSCRVFDMLGTWGFAVRSVGGGQVVGAPARIPDEVMERAIQGVLGTNADIRVFNLSLHGQPLDQLDQKDREEKLIHLQNLDNLAFTSDVLLVIAAGNSPPGVVPDPAYPRHIDHGDWKLGVLATSFNGVVVGALVDPLIEGGVVTQEGAPSPFTRIGPGMLRAPVPSFGAPGGDMHDHEEGRRGRGVWCVNADNGWEDGAGTSLSAPFVAREAAFLFRDLATYCPDGPPFAATVRALLTVFATRNTFTGALEKLAARTLGDGAPSSELLRRARPDRALFIWQTILTEPTAVARVQLPVPRTWRTAAAAPRLRLVVGWLTPVSAAASEKWACRNVSAQVKTSADDDAPNLQGSRKIRGAYPVSDRVFDIGDAELARQKADPSSETWVLEISYEELAPPPAGTDFTRQQKVGLAIELYDEGEAPVSPQAALQRLNITATMNRLAVIQVPLEVPITVR